MRKIQLIKIYFLILISVFLSLNRAQAQIPVTDAANLFVNSSNYFLDAANGAFTQGFQVTDGMLQGENLIFTGEQVASDTIDAAVQASHTTVLTEVLNALVGVGIPAAMFLQDPSLGTAAAIAGNLLTNQFAQIGLVGGINAQQAIDLKIDELFSQFSGQLTNAYAKITSDLATAGIKPSYLMREQLDGLVNSQIEQFSTSMQQGLQNAIMAEVPPGTIGDWVSRYINDGDDYDPNTVTNNFMTAYFEQLFTRPPAAGAAGPFPPPLVPVGVSAVDIVPGEPGRGQKLEAVIIDSRPYTNLITGPEGAKRKVEIAHDANMLRIASAPPSARPALEAKEIENYTKKINGLDSLVSRLSDATNPIYKELLKNSASLVDTTTKVLSFSTGKNATKKTMLAQLNAIENNCSGDGYKQNMQNSVAAAGTAGALFGMSAEGNNIKAMIQCTNEYMKLLTLVAIEGNENTRKIAAEQYSKSNEEERKKMDGSITATRQQVYRDIGIIINN